MRPGMPNPSIPGEAFNDTPMVNGTAYPYLEVEPRAYRFRILNAANDRFLNLQLYVAADKTTLDTWHRPASPGTPWLAALRRGPTDCTEVKMVPVNGAPEPDAPTRRAASPIPATAGPDVVADRHRGRLPGGAHRRSPASPSAGTWTRPPSTSASSTSTRSSSGRRSGPTSSSTSPPSPARRSSSTTTPRRPSRRASRRYDYFTGVADQIDIGGAPGTLPGLRPQHPDDHADPGRSDARRRHAADRHVAGHARISGVFAKGDTSGCATNTTLQARRLRGLPGPDPHPAGGLQLRLQQLVPGRRQPVPAHRGHGDDLPAHQQGRGPPAARDAPPADEGDARRDGRRL